MLIEDYAFLSDTETSALISRDGSVDWLCMPRFDSEACFAKLLGTGENGYWKIAPVEEVRQSTRSYRDGSLVLDSEFTTGTGRVRLTDFMPIRDESPDLIRIVEGLDGEVAMRMDLVIRFNHGKTEPWVMRAGAGVTAISGPNALLLQSDVETHGEGKSTVARFTVGAGEKVAFVLTWFPSHLKQPHPVRSEKALDQTEDYWRDWSSQHEPQHDWADVVKRSLLVLKGLTFAPTGGIVAAPTASLPEKLGGNRNWDYRFCWLRDAAFTLNAFLAAGYVEEAVAWRDWLLRAAAGSPDQVQVLYGVAGERETREVELSHLAGYESSRPVRIGNAASDQFQLDIYGEVLDSMLLARKAGIEPDEWSWDMQKHLVRYVISKWQTPDDGIWEVRGGRKLFTHSRMMAWVAVDRAIKACENFDLEGDLPHWRAVREKIHREVCTRGFNPDRNAFTQSFDSNVLDASILMMPLVGFLPATDPRVQATIEAVERELLIDGFVLRYHPDSSSEIDGLPPGEGAFLPCTFWLADCLHLLGRREEAIELFERVLNVRNDLGLLSEEYDTVNKRLVGNFPQAFSHVALINSASNLGVIQNQGAPERGKA